MFLDAQASILCLFSFQLEKNHPEVRWDESDPELETVVGDAVWLPAVRTHFPYSR